VGRETLGTGSKIVPDIVENKLPEVNAGDIVSNHVTESTQRFVNKLRGRDRKILRERTTDRPRGQKLKRKRGRVIKRYKFS